MATWQVHIKKIKNELDGLKKDDHIVDGATWTAHFDLETELSNLEKALSDKDYLDGKSKEVKFS